ncbi:protein FAM205A-like [Suncus etruscus]|uniref:protein FAM205A-like n=1 Tax=Suncus etruscus TaxID=109475 RepID=UPI00210F840C|nr:protein FAM205A-like [Suncus etruscus]
MLSTTFVLWDVGYPLYTYGSIFIIILIIWQVKKNYHRILEPTRSCCRRHKKVKKKERCATSKGRRHFREDNEKLLSVIKSQGWLPQEGSVRRLLCADPSCDICNNVALDIHQLLTGEQMLTSQNALRPSQSSARLEIMSKSTITFEQSPEDHFVSHSEELTLSSAVPVESHIKHQNSFTQLCVRSPSALSIQDYWSDCDQVTQKFQVTEVGYDPETRFSSEPKESEISACQQEAMMKATDISENQKQEVENSAISVYIPLTVNQDITAKALTHPMSLHMVAAHPNYPPNLSPEVLRLLEMHVKKWMHFQRWGLPRRVEESMRQFMPHPPTFFQSKNNQSVSFMQEETAGFSVENFGGISYKTWGSCMAGQPTQAFWVSEWSIIDQAHKYHYQQIQNHLAVVLHSPTFKDLSGKKMNNPVNHLQQKYRQLFCGLPSLHSESLVVNILDSQGFSLNETMSKLPIKDPFILQELSILPLPPKTPPKSSEPSPHSSSNEVNPSDNQPPQINVPFLTLAECEDLEWHVLQKQLQLQWGLPAIFQRSQRVPSPILCRPYDKTQSPEMVKTSWAEKHNSVLPEHSRRPLDFHFQRQLSQHRWGLPSKIQQSIQLVLSHNDQQTLSLRSTGADTNVGISQPTDQEATLAGESFTKLMNTELVHMPHLFAQAKAMLQSHIHSKCGQILQGNVPAYVYSSQGCMIPESVQVAPFTCNPESQTLELQASAGLDSQDKVIPWMPMTLDQEQQDPSAIVTEQPTLPQILSEGAIEKLETTLKHKYMTLSELPALYCVALSRAVSPENTTQAITTNMVDKPVESLAAESQIQMISSEAQMKKEIVPVIPEKESEPESPISTKKPILNKLKFHLKKKVLETQLGIPIKARKSRELILAIPEKITTQESLENLNKQEEALPRDFSIPSDITCGPDPEQIYHKKQLGVELIAMQKNQKQPLSCTVSHDSGQWVSKIPQPTSDMTAAQVLCVQLENNVSTPNLDEAWDHEPHSSSKRKDSTQIPTLTEKREDLGRHKNVGNQGEGDAGFVLASIKGSLPAEGQCQKRTLLNKTLHSHQHRSHQHSRQTMQNASHQPSRQDCPQLMLLKQTLGTHNENKGEKSSLRGSQAKISAIHKPARIPQYAQSVRSQMSQDQSFLGQPALRKPLQGQTLQHRFLQGQRMPVPAHKSSSLPESGLRNKMKSFLHCISPKTKDKRYHESMLSITEKVIRKELVQKNPASVKSPMEQTKREKTSENPMTQCTPTKKQVGVPSLPGPQSSENKLRHRSCSHQQHSESVLGPPRHCPRHCPRMAFVTQLRNPP